jgi:TonB family protein
MSMLMETTLKVSMVLLMALFASVLLRKRSAALRHWVLTVAIGCSLSVPLLLPIVPAWYRVPIWGMRSGQAHSVQGATPPGRASMTGPRQDVATEITFSGLPDASTPAVRVGVATVLQGVWLTGSVCTLFVLFAGLGRLWWLASHARHIESGRWHSLGEEVRRSRGLRFPVRLLHSRHPSLLVTWGWRHARILLPAAAEDWSDDEVRIVLAHELAHVVRGDWVAQLAAEVLRAIYWFNPLLWITCRRLRTESECACDDAVLASGVGGTEYATHLLTLARCLNTRRQPWLPAPAMARPSSLEGRIRAMLNTTRDRRPLGWHSRLAIVVALAVITVPISSVRAQSSFYSLTGTVLDPTSRGVPQARVVLTDGARQATYTIPTDDAGRFEFVGLPPASYRLEATLPGFERFTDNLVLSSSADREIRLQVGTLEETITISNQPGLTVPLDPATRQRREEARRRFAEVRQQEIDRCATGGAGATAGGRILPPVKVRDVRPLYPEALMALNFGGTVTMDAVIGTDGTVREVRNVQGPHPDLEAAATAAVRQWQFSPTLLNCEPIDVSMKVTTTFSLQP